MIITSASLAALNVGFKTTFAKAFETAEPTWKRLATYVPSTTGGELYPWLGAIPKFREWIGDRVVKALADECYKLDNKKFEMTISVPRTAIEDDQYGVYTPLMEQMGISAALYPDDLVYKALKNGAARKCYDGKPFFAANHKVGKATVSNLGTKKLTVESYAAARATMMSLLDEEGGPLKIRPGLLVVPPALEAMALKILKADLVDGGGTNIYKGTAELMVAPELAGDDTTWYLLDVSKMLKPILFQERQKPRFIHKDKPDDDNVFLRDEYVYGADARGNAGYGLWQMAYMSDGTEA